MFVPFIWRESNGFLNKTEIVSCLIDRSRLIGLIKKSDNYNTYLDDLDVFITENALNIAS